MERILSSRFFSAMAASIIAAAVFATYSNTFHGSFQFDDLPQIVENSGLRDLKNLPWILKGTRGVTMATFAFNFAIGGEDVFGFHVVNTVIHAINGVLVYLLLLNTFRITNFDVLWSRKVAFWSSLIFAVHPIQTQAVTYIVQRMESLASLFYITSVLFFAKAAVSENPLKRASFSVIVVFSYILGFYSKKIAITMPVVIFLYDLYFVSGLGIKELLKKRWPVHAALLILLIYFTISTVVPLGGFGDLSSETASLGASGGVGPAKIGTAPAGIVDIKEPSAGFGVKSMSGKEYLLTQFNVLVYYITLLIVPANQNLDYDFPISRSLFEVPYVKEGTVLNITLPPPFVSLLILLAIMGSAAYLLIRSRKGEGMRGRIVSFFIFWFFIILSPTSSFVPIIDVIFEHRVYLASLGFFVIFVMAIEGLALNLAKLLMPGEKVRGKHFL